MAGRAEWGNPDSTAPAFLSAVHQTPQTALSYSQFIADVSAHKVKTVTIAQTGATSPSRTFAYVHAQDGY